MKKKPKVKIPSMVISPEKIQLNPKPKTPGHSLYVRKDAIPKDTSTDQSIDITASIPDLQDGKRVQMINNSDYM